MHTPSKYQQAIYDFVANGRGNGFVNAVAGSGKTYTLIQCAKLISGLGIFCAFNKHIAEELGRKLEGTTMASSTIHSIGMRTLRKEFGGTRVNDRKYLQLASDLLGEAAQGSFNGTTVDKDTRYAIKDEWPIAELNMLCRLMRINLMDARDPKSISTIVDHYGLNFHPAIYPLLQDFMRAMMREGLRMARREIDFADMLWVPEVLNLHPDRYPWVFVDEAQDLNRAQLALVKRSIAPGGRALFVGDPHQAIYGFAGADANSTNNIIADMNCKVLPLSVCYRCPTTHVQLAQPLVPQIEAAPGAAEGVLEDIGEGDLVAKAREGDLVVCRTNAPLLSTCYNLIASGISASVIGRDIGQGLVSFINNVRKQYPVKPDEFAAQFPTTVSEYTRWEVDKLSRRAGNTEAAISALYDKAECIDVVFGACGAASYEALVQAIEMLFATDRPSIKLATVHKAKGLENGRVFILRPDLMPLRMQQQWQQQQEENLMYVAYTRAKEALYFVR